MKSGGNNFDFIAMTPPRASLCPPINLVALSTTISTPQSRGLTTYGLANVLSQTTTTLFLCAIFTKALKSGTFILGLAIDSKYNTFVFSFIAASTDFRSEVSTKVVSIP